MSKFGETADRILEILHNGEELAITKIEERLSLSDTGIILFMSEFGLIELHEGSVKITEAGLELLA